MTAIKVKSDSCVTPVNTGESQIVTRDPSSRNPEVTAWRGEAAKS